MNVNRKFFQQVLQIHPHLCASGLLDPDLAEKLGIDFPNERRRLEEAFDEFAACCDWLLDCTPLKHVSFVSPLSTELATHIEQHSGTPVSNGAVIAAVLHMRIPHHHPTGSADLRVGISRQSPALHSPAVR